MGNLNMKFIVELLRSKNRTISVMESCTGGAICSEITNIEGSSDIFKFGAVTYSNEYKVKFGVNIHTIEKYGVYSIEVAKEMSKKIALFTDSYYGVAVTGKLNCSDIRNPKGSDNKVHISFYDSTSDNFFNSHVEVFSNSRQENKNKVICEVVKIIYKNIV